MQRHKRARRNEANVELNLTAMLDMAFQLLAFFVLTFRPAPSEGELRLALPSPRPVAQPTGGPPPGANVYKLPSDLASLVISAQPNAGGGLGTLSLGETPVGGLASLDRRLREALGDPASPFDQVVIQVGSGLRYDAVLSLVDVCTRQRLATGKRLGRLSFVELPEAVR